MTADKKVLIVEDDSKSMKSTRSDLADELGAELQIASSINEALVKLRSEHYDLVIVDVRLPEEENGNVRDFGGVELIDKWLSLGNKSRNTETPFLFLTAQLHSLLRSEVVNSKRCLGAVKKLEQFKAIPIIRDFFEHRDRT